MEDERIDRGTIGEGLGCLTGALFGGTPMTGYSSNAGLIAIAKVASRRVVIAGGTILVMLGFCPKLMAVITSLPTPVINGVFAMVCMTLISNGVKMIKDTVMDDRATLILGVSVMCGVGTMILPDEVVQAALDSSSTSSHPVLLWAARPQYCCNCSCLRSVPNHQNVP